MNNKLDKLFKEAKKISIDKKSKIVIMSDCHRGTGDIHDNYIKNQSIHEAALNHYYKNNFTYIELGDGDDMWEVKKYKDIINENIHIFKILKKFNEQKRLIMVYGNHDNIKKKEKILIENFYKYYDTTQKKEKDLLTNLKVYEALILNYNQNDIFLIHGHQLDLLNSTFSFFSKFLVRYVWRHFENIFIKDPTKSAKNYQVTKRIEKKLQKWSIKNNKILIAGHTHRPTYPKVGKSLYFNDGSCIHPNGITCIEIEKGNITLVKWYLKIENEKIITVGKDILEGQEPIINFYK